MLQTFPPDLGTPLLNSIFFDGWIPFLYNFVKYNKTKSIKAFTKQSIFSQRVDARNLSRLKFRKTSQFLIIASFRNGKERKKNKKNNMPNDLLLQDNVQSSYPLRTIDILLHIFATSLDSE